VKAKIPLGKMLVEEGFIDEFQFKSALGHQRRYGGRFASQIVQLGFLDERTLAVFLARQHGFPAVVVSQSAFRVSNADALPKELALRYIALPALVERDKLLVVVANPTDMKALDEIRFVAGKRVVPHVALDSILRDMIQRLYEARAIGHETFVFGQDADTQVGDMGHVEIVTAQTAVSPPKREGVQVAETSEALDVASSPALPPMAAPLAGPSQAAGPPAMPGAHASSDLAPPPHGQTPPAAHPILGPAQSFAPVPGSGGPAPVPPPHGIGTAPGVPPPRAPENAGPPLVMIIDGDAELVPRLQATLLERGYRTTTAPDGVTATQVLRTQTPDAVVLEANLQGVHGFELCQKLRASRRFTDTPVVLLTSEYRGDNFRRDLRALFGVDLVIEKPFPIPLLARRLEELFVRARRAEARPDAAQQRSYHLFQQGMQLLTENRFDDAIALLLRGIAEDPLSEHLHFQLGNAYRRKAMDLHAMAELERAIELRPDFYPALRNLASLYQERGFRRKSFELWERAMENCPEDETRRKLKEHLLSYFA
jgi:CheY-like chemotaxis protein